MTPASRKNAPEPAGCACADPVEEVAQISIRLVSAFALVLVSTLFLIPLVPTGLAAKTSLARVCRSTHEIILAEATPRTNQARSEAIRKYLGDIFGVPGFKATWYDNIIDVEVAGDTATINTNLSGGDEKIINLCGVVSGFIYSHLNVQLDIKRVKILGRSGEVLVFRQSVMDDCPYKFSRNPGLQPPSR